VVKEIIVETPSVTNSNPPNYGTFCGPITTDTIGRFIHCLNVATQTNSSGLHILFQTSGGNIGDGIALHNFLKTYPIEVTLYNAGTIASVGVIIYMAAKRRVVSKHGTFMVHRSTSFPIGTHSASKLESTAKSLRIDDDRTEAILREYLAFSRRKWSDLRNNAEFWFSSKDAIASGMADYVGEFAPPIGTKIFSIWPHVI
jgi:ATP-dependent Clp protease protease subunit